MAPKFRGDDTDVELVYMDVAFPHRSVLREKKIFFGLLERTILSEEMTGEAKRIFRRGKVFYEDIILPGYRWDGASIPRILIPVVGGPFESPHFEPSPWHDIGYGAQDFPRSVEDDLFGCGIEYTARELGLTDYHGQGNEKELAVELFGGKPWKKTMREKLYAQQHRKIQILRSSDGERYRAMKESRK